MRTGHVLIVDDDRDLAESLGEYLELDGHRVDLAFGGQAGIAAALDTDYDQIIIDIGLPDIGGIEVASRILAARPAARMVLVTGHAAMDVEFDEAGLGVEMLVKPVRPDELARRVQESCDRPG